MGIEELIEGFKQLIQDQQYEVINEFYKHLVHGKIGISSIKEESDKLLGEKCPYCKRNSNVANGSLNGIQRYKCKKCDKSFSETTGTALEGLHKKDKFSKYLLRHATFYIYIFISLSTLYQQGNLSNLLSNINLFFLLKE